MRVERLFHPEAARAIEAAVKEAERRTSGEIVPMVVDRADAYPGLRTLVGAALAFLACVVILTTPLDLVLWLPLAQLVAFVVGYVLSGRRLVLRLLVPRAVAADAVNRAARIAFLEHGLTETRDRTGILIFIALLEHRVEVLADRGIDAHVEPGTWDGVVARILDGIRERRADEGLVAAIRHCGDLLAERFPPRPDDTDELADRLRT